MSSLSRILYILLIVISHASFACADDVVRILAIGNSFSEDAVESYLSDICRSEGYNVVIGNLYIAGCSIDTHCNNMRDNTPAYRFRLIDTGGKIREQKNVRLRDALRSQRWDYITFQQASQYSGLYDSYNRLPELLSAVRAATGSRPVFGFHMTWAYAADTRHAGFANYGSNQLRMYHDIVSTCRRVMDDNPQLKFVIPCGTAVQNARTAILAGDDLTRDGYHLDTGIGRYVASCTWFAAIFRRIISDNVYVPRGISHINAVVARDAAHEAVMHPWRITPIRIETSGHAPAVTSAATVCTQPAVSARRDTAFASDDNCRFTFNC